MLAGGSPAATVSRDVSSYPTWKQEPPDTYYSRWSAVAVSRVVSPAGPSRPRLTGFESIPLLTESTHLGRKFLKSAKSKSSSRLASMANRFKNLVLATAQKRIGSALTSSRFYALIQSSFEKTFSRIDSREVQIDLRKTFYPLFENESVRLMSESTQNS
ncbi:hypothetical protein PIB30_021710 [Stylosanthes scabra]|uniref:Uncharacterized protein n=1 Tax=Stylosanthes scabra TaxID=79078 RepID=A0ABU6R989_9FABA|nr:hypothetical protein [Stylosanthes scabra]